MSPFSKYIFNILALTECLSLFTRLAIVNYGFRRFMDSGEWKVNEFLIHN